MKRQRGVMFVLVLLLWLGASFRHGGGFAVEERTENLLVKVHEEVENPEVVIKELVSSVRPNEDATIESLPLADSGVGSLGGSVFRLGLPAGTNEDEALAAFNESPDVVYAEKDAEVRAFFTPNDPSYPSQWHFGKVNLEAAWDFDTSAPLYGGDASIIVAVIDTGVAFENYTNGSATFQKAPDFAQTNFSAGYDYVNDDAHPNDDNGHGTHVSATIAESTNNALSASGVAFNATLMPLKVLDRNGVGSMADVATAIDFAVTNGADVINLSLGSSTASQTLEDAVQRALAAGVAVVAAAGNDTRASLSYPAASSGVVSVSAIGRDDVLASYSNYGTGLSLTAPGGDDGEYIWQQGFSNLDSNNLPVDYVTFGLVGFQGTSQAAPHVSGAAALLLARGASGANVKTLLENAADDLGPAGYDTQYGFGRLDIQGSLSLLVNDTTVPTTSLSVVPASPDGQNGYYMTKPTITLSAIDETGGSGVSRILYQWDSGTVTTYTEPFAPPEGTHTLTYYSVDGAGNLDTGRTYDFKVDSVAPVIAVTSPAATVNNPLTTVSGSVTDETSGVTSFTLDGAAVTVATDGAFTFAKTLPLGATTLLFEAHDGAGSTSTKSQAVVVSAKARIVVAPGPGGGPQTLLATEKGKVLSSFLAYAKSFRGGVKVSFGNVDGLSGEEILTGPGKGSGPQVRVFSKNGALIRQFFAYNSSFRGGVNVAAGDLDGDGKDEIITGPGSGGGPQIRFFSNKAKLLGQFDAYAGSFRGGVNVAAGDLDGDGRTEILTAPASAAGPHVKIFSHKGKLVGQFFAFEKNFRGGVSVATGDVDGDGLVEILAGVASGAAPQIRIFTKAGKVEQQWFAYAKTFLGGITIASGFTD